MDNKKTEKRQNRAVVPDSLNVLLNPAQRHALRQIEKFGWHLEFVRQPVFQEPIAVVVNGKGDQIGLLETDGRINMQAEIALRTEPLAGQPRETGNG